MKDFIRKFDKKQLKILMLSDYIFSRYFDDKIYINTYKYFHTENNLIKWPLVLTDLYKKYDKDKKESRSELFIFLNKWGTRVSYELSQKVELVFENSNKKDAIYKGKLSKKNIGEIFTLVKNASYKEKRNIKGKAKECNVSLGSTGASKLIHILRPDKFPIIDSYMKKVFLKVNNITSDDYISYCDFYDSLIVKINGLNENIWNNMNDNKVEESVNKTPYKFLDEYFWLTVSKEKTTQMEKDLNAKVIRI